MSENLINKLYESIRNKNYTKIKSLLQLGASPNHIFDDYGTPLHMAVNSNDLFMVKLFLKYKADPNIKNTSGHTPTLIASHFSYNDILLELSKTANLDISNNYGDTPLHIATRNNSFNTVKILLDMGANLDILDNKGYTPLHIAVKNNYIEICELLLAMQANPNIPDINGLSPLFYVIINFNPVIAFLLLKYNANVNYLNNEGNTPLFYAVLNENLEAVNFLLENGAVNINNTAGYSPMHLAVVDIEMLQIFINNNIDPNIQNMEGQTLLMKAIENYNIDIITLLLNNKANPNIHDNQGNTALNYCINIGDFQHTILKLLLEKNANDRYLNNNGEGILHIAVYIQDIDAVKLLLDKGAYIDYQDNNGDTPLHIAIRLGNSMMTEFLLEYMPDLLIQNNKDEYVLDIAIFLYANYKINLLNIFAKVLDLDELIFITERFLENPDNNPESDPDALNEIKYMLTQRLNMKIQEEEPIILEFLDSMFYPSGRPRNIMRFIPEIKKVSEPPKTISLISRPDNELILNLALGSYIDINFSIPVIRYSSGMSKGLYHGDNTGQYCGTFYYYDIYSKIFLMSRRTFVVKNKIQAMLALDKEATLDAIYELVITKIEIDRDIFMDYAQNRYHKYLLDEDGDYIDDFLAIEDVLDQPICIKAIDKYDVIILLEMPGRSRVVTEVLDVRKRLESFQNLYHLQN